MCVSESVTVCSYVFKQTDFTMTHVQTNGTKTTNITAVTVYSVGDGATGRYSLRLSSLVLQCSISSCQYKYELKYQPSNCASVNCTTARESPAVTITQGRFSSRPGGVTLQTTSFIID